MHNSPLKWGLLKLTKNIFMVTFYIMLYQMGVYNRTYSFAPRPPEKYLTSARSNFKFPWKNRFRMGVIKVRLFLLKAAHIIVYEDSKHRTGDLEALSTHMSQTGIHPSCLQKV